MVKKKKRKKVTSFRRGTIFKIQVLINSKCVIKKRREEDGKNKEIDFFSLHPEYRGCNARIKIVELEIIERKPGRR